ncbi:MAG: sigma-70 family RNA polymerase sigma factor [Planctomycetes bacterium]|nr:sigma-70 family RNA polymerase sigma factor [Planctomycetota bacterium]
MDPTTHGPSAFPPTAWSLLGRIAAGGAERDGAIEAIARLYWKPVYVYLRRKGRPESEAPDLVQSFFIHLLEKDLLARPDPARGRFRNWLRAVLEHFLANEARLRTALKKGGGRKPLSLELDVAESAVRSGSELTPEEAFHRTWALEVLERAFARLSREYKAAGKDRVLRALRQRLALPEEDGAESPAAGPKVDGVTLHRARKRLKALILDEVGDSVRDPGALDEEVGDLFQALGRKR